MKLLFAIKQLERAAGGAERVLAKICSELACRGHQVSVLTWDPPNALPFYPFDDRVRLWFRGIGNAFRPSTPTETIRRVIDLHRFVIREAPDVAVGFCHAMFVPLALALSGSGIPVIGSEHITIVHYRTRRLQYALMRLAARSLRCITVMSETIRSEYTADVRSRMVVLPNPIMVQPRCPAARCSDAAKMILNVGRLDAQKDQSILIRAFALLATEYPDWNLRIVGEGALRPRLERLVCDLRLDARVSLPGISDKIEEEYARADVFAMPSLYESFGLASIEAMAQGLPVVGFSDCRGINEVVTNGFDGILVQPSVNRAESLAAGLRTLMMDDVLRKRLGEQGRQSVDRMICEDQAVEQWCQLLDRIAAC